MSLLSGPNPLFSSRELHSELSSNDSDAKERVLSVLKHMRSVGLDLESLLHLVCWGSDTCRTDPIIQAARTRFTHYEGLPALLTRLANPPRTGNGKRSKGAGPLIGPWAFQHVQDQLKGDMKIVAKALRSNSEDFSREHVAKIDLDELCQTFQADTPHLWNLIRSICTTERQDEANSFKNPQWPILQIFSIASFSSSHANNKIAKLNTVYMRATGVPVRVMDTMSAYGVTMSYSWVSRYIKALADSERAQAVEAADPNGEGAVAMNYDNFNVAKPAFEQRLLKGNRFLNGTVLTIRTLPPAAKLLCNRVLLDAGRARAAAQNLTPHDFLDPTAGKAVTPFLLYHILSVILNSPDFSTYKLDNQKCKEFKPPAPVDQCDPTFLLKLYVLATVPIDESSYEGNAQVLDKYYEILKWDTVAAKEWLAKQAVVPISGDGLTHDRLKGLQTMRARSVNGIERLDAFAVDFGWLHAEMAVVNSIHAQHLGTAAGFGITHAAITLKRKKVIKVDKRDAWYHHIEEIIIHSCSAHILDCFLQVGKVKKLAELTKKTPAELVSLALEVYTRYVSSSAIDSMEEAKVNDKVFYGAVLFMRDSLHYVELVAAIRAGDVGRMANLVPHFAYRMVGGGNGNYAKLFLGLWHQIRVEWSPDIKKLAMHHNWLVTNDGKVWFPVDQATEFIIRDVKDEDKLHGPEETFELLEKITPAIPALQKIKKHVQNMVGGAKRGSRHTIPKSAHDIQTLADAYRRSNVHVLTPGRRVKSKGDRVVDFVANGEALVLRGKALDDYWKKRGGNMPRSTDQLGLDGDAVPVEANIDVPITASSEGVEATQPLPAPPADSGASAGTHSAGEDREALTVTEEELRRWMESEWPADGSESDDEEQEEE